MKARLQNCIQNMNARRDEAARNYREQAGDKAAEGIRRFYQDRIDQMQSWLRNAQNGEQLDRIDPCLREFEQLANPSKF
jgi:hypothetical protein